MSIDLITEHLDLWTSTVTYNNGKGRGNNGEPELTGIDKLRELILELAVRGKLVPQDPEDEPASELLERIEGEKARLYQEGKIKKPKKLAEITEEEKPFNLPDGWSWVRFGEIAFPQAGFAFKSKEFNYSGAGLPLIRIRDVGQPFSRTYYNGEYREEFVVESGDYLVSMDGVFRVAPWHGGKALLNQRVTRLIFYSEALAQRFFAENLQLQLEKLQGVKAYTTVDHLSGKQINETIVALPPAEEQQRIVEKVDELMALCDRLEQQTSDQLSAHEALVDILLDTLTRSRDAAELAENWARLAAHFDTLFTTEHSIDRLEQTILQLAVRGKLAPQDPEEEPVSELLDRIEGEKARLYKEGQIKKPKKLPEIGEDEKPFSLPIGWVWERLPNVYYTLSTSGKSLKTSEIEEEGHYPVIDQGQTFVSGYTDDQEKLIDIPKPVVVFGDHTTARKYVDFNFAPGADGTKVLCPVGLFPRYFYIYLLSCRLEDRGYARHFKVLNSHLISIPPLEQQYRIVEKVDELMVLCDRLKACLKEAGEIQSELAESLVKWAVA